MADKFGYPAPDWSRDAIVGIHIEIDEIRNNANDKCRKSLTPASPFGQDVQHWYDKIHVYLALMKIFKYLDKIIKYWTHLHIRQKKGIKIPKLLTVVEIIDGLKICRIRQTDARKRATQSRDKLLRECLATANDNDNKKQVSGIKQIMSGEKGKRFWSITCATVNDLRTPLLQQYPWMKEVPWSDMMIN